MTRDHLDEALNIDISRDQRDGMAKHDRWYLALLAADLSEIEAKQVIIDVQAGEERAVAA